MYEDDFLEAAYEDRYLIRDAYNEAAEAEYNEDDFDSPDPWDEDEDECPGHESLSGSHMGESVYCDGSCL